MILGFSEQKKGGRSPPIVSYGIFRFQLRNRCCCMKLQVCIKAGPSPNP